MHVGTITKHTHIYKIIFPFLLVKYDLIQQSKSLGTLNPTLRSTKELKCLIIISPIINHYQVVFVRTM